MKCLIGGLHPATIKVRIIEIIDVRTCPFDLINIASEEGVIGPDELVRHEYLISAFW